MCHYHMYVQNNYCPVSSNIWLQKCQAQLAYDLTYWYFEGEAVASTVSISNKFEWLVSGVCISNTIAFKGPLQGSMMLSQQWFR